MCPSKKYVIKPEFLPVLEKLQALGKPIEARELSAQLNLEYEKLMSGAVYSFNQIGIAKYTEEEVEMLSPTEEGKSYAEKGLPERRLFTLLSKDGRKEMKVPEFQKEAEVAFGFDKKIFFIGTSNMKKNRWVSSSKAEVEVMFVVNEQAPATPEEQILKLFIKNAAISAKSLGKELEEGVKTLLSRKLVIREKRTQRMIELTPEGKGLKKENISLLENEVFQITPTMITSGSWKDNIDNLKKYDVNALGPRINVGKSHPIPNLINEIREIFHSMGFNEIKGPMIELAFFNFDALYQPQDHPAREMHDTFYLRNPIKGRLPNAQIVSNIKNTHENGGDSGSIGWRYKWSESIAEKMLLRTHTTATTLRRLSQGFDKDTKFPQKFFCIDHVFRNEKVDWKHLAEFQQIEGIIVGENVSLCDLRGQIVEFYRKMGFKKIVTRPGFFPYTEPSMEIAVFSEEKGKWLEMGGSGIFRPEVAYPWGIKNPMRVLAWGMGFERLAMLKLKRADIRDLYQSPISWLREVPY